ncbi:uncharacterized protein [Antedon mediterranea]|uniref:uncharacterized protein n=1 Tax=Antedon mediterranea TaxID=105859 RepID=UPI003AF45D8A
MNLGIRSDDQMPFILQANRQTDKLSVEQINWKISQIKSVSQFALALSVGVMVVLALIFPTISVRTGSLDVQLQKHESRLVQQEATILHQEKILMELQTNIYRLQEELLQLKNKTNREEFEKKNIQKRSLVEGQPTEIQFVDGSSANDFYQTVSKQTTKTGTSGVQIPTIVLRGKDGRDGRDGLPGPTGPIGEAGRNGHDGTPGLPGPQGMQGLPGLKGDRGQPGYLYGANCGSIGNTYIRWGKRICPKSAELVYQGVVGGSSYNHEGGLADLQCLPHNPVLHRPLPPTQQDRRAFIFGAEYNTLDFMPLRALHNRGAVCAVCRVVQRSTVLMVPGTSICPVGWLAEYDGYLMASSFESKGRQTSVCVDRMAEARSNSLPVNENGAILSPVERGACDRSSLPCRSYARGAEFTCTVCTL